MGIVWIGMGAVVVGAALILIFWPYISKGEHGDRWELSRQQSAAWAVWLMAGILIVAGLSILVFYVLRLLSLVS